MNKKSCYISLLIFHTWMKHCLPDISIRLSVMLPHEPLKYEPFKASTFIISPLKPLKCHPLLSNISPPTFANSPLSPLWCHPQNPYNVTPTYNHPPIMCPCTGPPWQPSWAGIVSKMYPSPLNTFYLCNIITRFFIISHPTSIMSHIQPLNSLTVEPCTIFTPTTRVHIIL